MKRSVISLAGALAFLAAPALTQDTGGSDDGPHAIATFIGLDGETIGQVNLTRSPEGVHISGEVAGLAPGERGFHFHEIGVCDPETGFETAGEHFNPDGSAHGHLADDGPHAGDMPNQTVDEDGVLRIDLTNTMVTLGDGDADLLAGDGTALMIHQDADDYETQPGGDAGDRIACAVVELSPETGEAEEGA